MAAVADEIWRTTPYRSIKRLRGRAGDVHDVHSADGTQSKVQETALVRQLQQTGGPQRTTTTTDCDRTRGRHASVNTAIGRLRNAIFADQTNDNADLASSMGDWSENCRVEFRATLAPAQQAMIREANSDDINPRR